MGLEAQTLIVSVLVGALIGRWWSIVLALPAGLIAASTYSFEGFSNTGVGVLFGIAVGVGLLAGTALGKGVRVWSGRDGRA